MAVQLESRERVLVANLSGEIDHHTAAPLREAMDAAIERHNPKQLRMDFSNVSFMDSSGVGLIMGRYRQMRIIGGDLRVCGAGERVRLMMRMAGLDRLDIWESEEETHACKSRK